MFQFRRFPTYTYLIQHRLVQVYCTGFPHSEISGSKLICSSPKLIAAYHVLHRLLMPRHSPCALISLTNVRSFHYLQACRKSISGFSLYKKNYAGSIKEYLAKIVFYPKFLFPYCCLLITFIISIIYVQFSRYIRALLKARWNSHNEFQPTFKRRYNLQGGLRKPTYPQN